MHATPDTPLRLGQTHGYRFDGDVVHLNAELQITNPAATAAGEWALQLWACDSVAPGALPAGIKVAELRCQPDTTFDTAWIDATVAALPPAGQGEHVMVLALVSGHDGRFDTLCDTARFPRTERFVQPRLVGSTGFGLESNHVTVHVDSVDNPRDADNLSGSLSLELWALSAPYASDEPAGTRLATAALGVLGGGQSVDTLDFDLPLAARPAGTWHIALLLREWTGEAYATRDFSNFTLPVSFAAEPESPAAAAEAPAAQAIEAAEAEAAPAPAAKKPAARKASAKSAAPASGVCINTASATELSAVKGLPKTVAAAIVAARPFARLDDLLAVKGMGEKLLDKLRAALRV